MRKPIEDWPSEPLDRDREIPEPGEGSAWIQWKGTNVCMDVRCRCGANGHIDAEFAYFYKCLACGVTFTVGMAVRLYPMSEGATEKHGEHAKVDERYCLRWSGRPCDCGNCGGDRGLA